MAFLVSNISKTICQKDWYLDRNKKASEFIKLKKNLGQRLGSV
jgi:hypothetical protein